MKILKTLIKLTVSFGTLWLSYYLMREYLFGHTLSLIVCLSIALHEVGHALAFLWYGQSTVMFFIPFLGAAVVPTDIKKAEAMSWWQDAVVALSGPAMNFGLVIAGLVLAFGSPQTYWVGMAIASVNATLGAINLIPLFILDGGRVAKAVFDSANEEWDAIISLLMTIASLILGLIFIFTNHFGFFYLMVIVGLHWHAHRDNPDDHHHVKAMSHEEVGVIVVIWSFLLFWMWLGYYLLPPLKNLMEVLN